MENKPGIRYGWLKGMYVYTALEQAYQDLE